MDFDYTRRDYLLPPGCKDLMDALKSEAKTSPFKVTHQADGFIVTFTLGAGLLAGDIDIVIEGKNLRVFCKAHGGGRPQENVMAVPPGYDLARALATYIDDALRIFIPKC